MTFRIYYQGQFLPVCTQLHIPYTIVTLARVTKPFSDYHLWWKQGKKTSFTCLFMHFYITLIL